jgi:hypothetical protein
VGDTKMGRDVFDGMTRLKQLHILKTIFKCVLFLHNKTPKVFCLTFGVHVIDRAPLFCHFLSRREFDTTQTLESAMQAAATMGFSRNPVNGYRMPAAMGTARML